jgi:hypothetical protein
MPEAFLNSIRPDSPMTRKHRDVLIDKAVKRAKNSKEKNRNKQKNVPVRDRADTWNSDTDGTRSLGLRLHDSWFVGNWATRQK